MNSKQIVWQNKFSEPVLTDFLVKLRAAYDLFCGICKIQQSNKACKEGAINPKLLKITQVLALTTSTQ